MIKNPVIKQFQKLYDELNHPDYLATQDRLLGASTTIDFLKINIKDDLQVPRDRVAQEITDELREMQANGQESSEKYVAMERAMSECGYGGLVPETKLSKQIRMALLGDDSGLNNRCGSPDEPTKSEPLRKETVHPLDDFLNKCYQIK